MCRLWAALAMAALSVVMTTALAPMAMAVSRLFSDRVRTVTSAPMAVAIFTPMCPRPPSPATPTFIPGVMPKFCFSGGGERGSGGGGGLTVDTYLEGREARDAGAQERRGGGAVELGRDADHVVPERRGVSE